MKATPLAHVYVVEIVEHQIWVEHDILLKHRDDREFGASAIQHE
jgi:hypothetical protein